MKVAVVGASGFVGKETARRLREEGHTVVAVAAPRLRTAARDIADLATDAAAAGPRHQEDLVRALSGADVLVNCAGLARPTSSADDGLYGANALLPVVLFRASTAAGIRRFVHVSTAAVLGSGTLRDGWHSEGRTPYARSKALGEQGLKMSREEQPVDLRILRPTSVHGPERDVTRTLTRLARSPAASMSGNGSAASPQVLVGRVAQVLAALAVLNEAPGHPLIQPWDGVTVRSVLEDLGDGSAPRSLPVPVARFLVAIGSRVPQAWIQGQTRRVEMLWFGQRHEAGWLAGHGFDAELDREVWREVGRQAHKGGRS